MVSEETLQQLTERIVVAAKPSRVIVFGSYGRGDADEGSDLDIIVIQPTVADQVAEMVRLRQVIGSVGTGVDVLVYPEDEYERRSQVPGTLPYWARKEGRTLYAATH
ncbi:MAG: nucleotidyltransferase domain-containing protein [Chloroflexota bacterium]|nr:MAG: nucleotidyltransferase domain-containing protein [Chloroflexota bacterium]